MDARSRYTIMVIRNSLFELLKENQLSKITVKSICELSEINRATFYRYYSDPYDLLEKIEAELLEELQKLVKQANPDNILDMMMLVFTAIREDGEFYCALFSENGDSKFKSKILSLCYEKVESGIHGILPKASKAQLEWYYYFLAQGCMSVMEHWVRGGMHEDPYEVSSFIAQMSHALQSGLV